MGTYRVRLLRRARLSESVFEIELERPAGFRFSAGQRVSILANRARRDYSLAGAPSAAGLTLIVRRIEGGAVSPLLGECAPGTPLELTGPHGLFTFTPSELPAVFVATGVGIAPLLSFVRSGARGFTLLHGVRARDELLYREELRAASGLYVPCLSREEAPGCHHGRVTDWSREHLRPGAFDFFLCGSRQMTRDMIVLVDERFPGSRVHTEIFF